MTAEAPLAGRDHAREASLKAEYLRLYATVWPDRWATVTSPARDFLRGYAPELQYESSPTRDVLLARWRELRYHRLDPWWVLSADPLLAAPPGLPERGRQAIWIMFGVVVYLRERMPECGRTFFRPDEGPAYGVDPTAVHAATVLLIRHGSGAVGCSFGGVGYPGVVLPREMRRALRSGGFLQRNVSSVCTALDDCWAEPIYGQVSQERRPSSGG